MRNIEFVSYDGMYPNLCSGTLTLRVDGKLWSCSRCLISGGECWWDSDIREEVYCHGPWGFIDQGDEFSSEEQLEIVRIVNENVEWGCCGGCL